MWTSLEQNINVIEPFIPGNLIDLRYLKVIKEISGCLPMLSLGCFECYLGTGERRVDFNISVANKFNEPESLIDALANEASIDSGGGNISNFCKHWIDKHFPLKHFIGDLWLVFDIKSPDQRINVPWYYVRFTSSVLMNNAQFKQEIIFKTLNYLNEPFDQHFIAGLKDFLKSIPAPIIVNAVGIKKKSVSQSVRVYLITTNYHQIFEFLQRTGWTGNIPNLKDLISSIKTSCNFFGVSIDWEYGLSSELGVEIWVDENNVSNELTLLTDKLVKIGCCTVDQQQSILAWEGTCTVKDKFWPDDSHALNRAYINQQERVIRRFSRYIKIKWDAREEVHAKAYLYFESRGDSRIRTTG